MKFFFFLFVISFSITGFTKVQCTKQSSKVLPAKAKYMAYESLANDYSLKLLQLKKKKSENKQVSENNEITYKLLSLNKKISKLKNTYKKKLKTLSSCMRRKGEIKSIKQIDADINRSSLQKMQTIVYVDLQEKYNR